METNAVGVLRNHTTNDPDGFRGYLLYTAGTPTNRGDFSQCKNTVGNHNGLRCSAPGSMGFSRPEQRFPPCSLGILS